MRQGDLYSVAERLGQEPLVSDNEFFTFVVEEEGNIPFVRRMRLAAILRKEPWRTELDKERSAARASRFVNADPDRVQRQWKELSDALTGG